MRTIGPSGLRIGKTLSILAARRALFWKQCLSERVLPTLATGAVLRTGENRTVILLPSMCNRIEEILVLRQLMKFGLRNGKQAANEPRIILANLEKQSLTRHSPRIHNPPWTTGPSQCHFRLKNELRSTAELITRKPSCQAALAAHGKRCRNAQPPETKPNSHRLLFMNKRSTDDQSAERPFPGKIPTEEH